MKNNILYSLFFLSVIGIQSRVTAQNDLLAKLDREISEIPQYEIATFESTRIALGQSVQVRKKNVLEIVIMNRFWDKPIQKSQSFLVDKLSTRIGLEYGLSDKLTIGAGATTLDSSFDGFAKYNLFRQRKDNSSMPVTMTFFQNASYRSKDVFDTFENRFSFTSQLLIARKLTTNLSIQIAPTYIHRASSFVEVDPQNQFAVGFGIRRKVGKHVSLVSDYYYQTNSLVSKNTYNAFSVGANWELSYILLQFHFTNARAIEESAFITRTTNNFNSRDGNLHFGFNAIFTLQLDKRKRKKMILK